MNPVLDQSSNSQGSDFIYRHKNQTRSLDESSKRRSAPYSIGDKVRRMYNKEKLEYYWSGICEVIEESLNGCMLKTENN